MLSRRLFLLSAGSLAASAYPGREVAGQESGAGREVLRAPVGSLAQPAAATGRTLYVAPAGEDGEYPARGTVKRPFATLPHAFAEAAAGDRILLRGGVYGFDGAAAGWLLAGHDGEPGRPIVVENHPGEFPVIDGAAMRPPTERYQAWPGPKSAGGFPLAVYDASHLVLRGLTVRNGPMGGCLVDGVHHDLLIERCVFHDNGWLNDEFGTGLAIFGRGDRNIVQNCDSFGNHGGGPGATGGNADGIAVSIYDSVGTVVSGNRAWRNSDDGFDFFNPSRAEHSRNGSPCLIDCNWAFENGCNPDGSINPSEDANGCGFKLGGRRPGATGRHGGHIVTRCLAWGNKTSGFDDNGYNGGLEPLAIFNNVSFENARGQAGYGFIVQHHAATVLRNNIVFAIRGARDLELGPVSQSHNASNGAALASLSSESFSVSLGDFACVEDAIARGPRQQDGSLPVSCFLRLAKGSRLIGAGSSLGLPTSVSWNGSALNLGAFQAR